MATGPDDVPPPPEFPPNTAREKRDLAIAAAADAFRVSIESGHLQPLSPTYLTRQYVQGEIDESIRTYDEEKHSLDPGDGHNESALDKLVHLDGAIDALQTLRYKIFGQPLDLTRPEPSP